MFERGIEPVTGQLLKRFAEAVLHQILHIRLRARVPPRHGKKTGLVAHHQPLKTGNLTSQNLFDQLRIAPQIGRRNLGLIAQGPG